MIHTVEFKGSEEYMSMRNVVFAFIAPLIVFVGASNASDQLCSSAESVFQQELKNMWDCAHNSWEKYSDSSASASEVSSTVSYECSIPIRKLAGAQYNSVVCELSKKTGKSFAEVADGLPAKETEISKSEKEIKGIVAEKAIAETVKYRAAKK
ncbi:hypothetical protein L9209_000527 [Klebsiella aerogenes]|uniref:hypothetical protein n=1 Tax=Klebsiella aerogenes TaxID=548 RepID=UPI00063CB40B|nr:hypothetical protein [Klebsiella aerogenes]EIV6705726.1 hypothetical protein [Klebsiella aerogenes]EKU8837790.1 hypothetical protein [Klebsiella aerogenes]ELA2524325.1 hypothetical protein [Klebsiella aerogenes]KLE40658.1 hypothetical protein YA12_24700 [Klebsiella aerogenes]